MRRTLIRGCVAGVFAVVAITVSPAGQALAATAVEYSAPALGLLVGSVPSPDMKIPCTPGGLC